ncbi:MAG TPA: hypothetical protein VMM13_16200 [Euzebya sp.]|nr:hypothetical protein [Euzebya sp.]
MSDRLDVEVRQALHAAAAAAQPSPPDPGRVRADAARGQDRGGRVLAVAMAVIAVAILGAVTLQVLDRPNGVLLDDGDGLVPASADVLIGRTFESTSTLPGAPDSQGLLQLTFRPPYEEDQGPGRVTMGADTEPGCNAIGGLFTVEDGRARLHSDIATTLIGCPGLRQDMDDWAAGLLRGEPQLLLDGEVLVVVADGGRIDMVEVEVVIPSPSPQPSPTQSIVPGGNCQAVATTLAGQLVDITATADLDAFRTEGVLPAEAWQTAVAEASTTAQCDDGPLLMWTAQDAYSLAIPRFDGTAEADGRYRVMGALLSSVTSEMPVPVPTHTSAPASPHPDAMPTFGPSIPVATNADGERIYTVVHEGDTLAVIAEAAYGDYTLFGLIADANELTGEQPMEVGQQLVIPADPNADPAPSAHGLPPPAPPAVRMDDDVRAAIAAAAPVEWTERYVVAESADYTDELGGLYIRFTAVLPGDGLTAEEQVQADLDSGGVPVELADGTVASLGNPAQTGPLWLALPGDRMLVVTPQDHESSLDYQLRILSEWLGEIRLELS